MLKQNQGSDNGEENKAQVNMAGKALLVSENNEVWIIDTGATNQMVSKIGLMTKESIIRQKVPHPIYLPNGEVSNVTHIGSCFISPRSVITNVYHILEFKYNLLSVSKVTKEWGCLVTFFPHFCVFQDLYTGKVREIGKENDGLYLLLNHLTQAQLQHVACAASRKVFDQPQISEKDIELWHRRLGHMSSHMLNKL